MTSLYQSLDTQLTIGCSQILFDDDLNPRIENSTDHVDNDLFTKIEYFLTENKFEEFRCEIKHLVEGCKRKERTQLYVEGIIHRIYHYLITCAKNSPNTDMYEFMLDDAFFYASSYDELESNLFEIFQQIIKDDYGTFDRVDTPEFFTAVDAYIDANFAKALSLQGLCSTFGISQTYMSKMFRKYTGLSFSGYVKQVRVQKAKELLTTQRSLKIKDIAAMVGIRDQFYFSRLFHTVTGMTPSEFAAVTLPE
jgi:two-component system, response regulator YesN